MSIETHLAELLPILEEAGVKLLVAQYSGGNDEGGTDRIDLYSEITNPGYEDTPEGGNKIEIEDMGWDHPVWRAVDYILSTKYYTWAGEFSAHGELYVDVAAKRCWMDGSESVEQSIDIHDSIDVTLA